MRPLSLIVVFLLALVPGGCGKKAAPASPPTRSITAAKAEVRDVPLYIDEIGRTTAVESVNVQAQVAGQIQQVHFEDGAEVAKGDMLFTIDPRPYQAALDKAAATLAQTTAKLEFQRAQMVRMEELRRKNVATTQDFDQARATLSEYEAIVRGDQANLDNAKLNLEYCSVRAPISGRLGKRLVDAGNVVTYPGGPILVSIQKQDPLYVDFTIAEDKLPAVRAYQKNGTLRVEAWFATEPQKRRAGEFAFLDNAVQLGNGTVRLRARIPNEDRLFWPGQFVNVRLILDTVKSAVVIPSQALQTGQIGTFVFVVSDDMKAAIRPIRPGQRQGSDIVIEDGVKGGEIVVLTGQLLLSPGAPVKIVGGPAATGTAPAAKADPPKEETKKPL
jgi:multidrug efflux system membrane fusion protein